VAEQVSTGVAGGEAPPAAAALALSDTDRHLLEHYLSTEAR